MLLKLIGLVMPLRATANEESTGLDVTMHGEEAYLHAGGMEALPHSEAARPAAVPAGSPVAVQ